MINSIDTRETITTPQMEEVLIAILEILDPIGMSNIWSNDFADVEKDHDGGGNAFIHFKTKKAFFFFDDDLKEWTFEKDGKRKNLEDVEEIAAQIFAKEVAHV